MRDYEEKSYYEIQLDNKQLILVFLAAVTVCVLIFVLGVMIGKGQKEAEFAAAARNEKNQTPSEPDANPPRQALTDLASDARSKDESLPKEAVAENPAPVKEEEEKKPEKIAATEKKQPEKKPEKQPEKYAYEELDKAEPAAVAEKKAQDEPVTEEIAEDEPKPAGNSRYTVQVMATSSKPKAEEQITRLKSRGYKPFMDESKTGEVSVFKVRVGKFADTDEAKKMASRIKSDLKLETWVAVLD